MKRIYLWFLAGLICPLLITSCGKDKKGQQPQGAFGGPVPVNTYTVSEQPVTGIDAFPATVVPLREVQLRPQVAGYITEIYAWDGQEVKEGQKLYEIDRSKYQAGFRQAQANLKGAQANLDKVRRDLERYEKLNEKQAIAKQQVDYAKANYETAEAQVMAAQAQLASASTDLRYSVITAPFTGTIGISQVRIGSQVSPGQTLLNTISADNPVAVDIAVSERDISRFIRMSQNSKLSDSTFIITLADGTDYPYPAKISAIDRAVDRLTGTIKVRLSVQNPQRHLISGMTVEIKVQNQDVGRKVVIPFKAVTEQMGEFYAYVVSGDSVVQRKLELGSRVNDKVVVREGLQDGETIVVEGIQRLRQGAKIQVGSPAAQGQSPQGQPGAAGQSGQPSGQASGQAPQTSQGQQQGKQGQQTPPPAGK